MLIDTHCHLNFKTFAGRVGEVIERAQARGVSQFIVPGTDIVTSEKTIELAREYPSVWSAVGIHPHHLYEYHSQKKGLEERLAADLEKVEELLQKSRVVAVGEVGIDRYYYRDTKYSTYVVDEVFVELQKKALLKQMKLAIKYDKALILHNRLAVEDILEVLDTGWDASLSGRTVFHCCEADPVLLEFAQKHQILIGVDGDISWSKKKQRFIKEVPLKMLVLETDSPYLTPEPAKAESKINEPGNLTYVRDFVALAQGIEAKEVAEVTTSNAHSLFNLKGL